MATRRSLAPLHRRPKSPNQQPAHSESMSPGQLKAQVLASRRAGPVATLKYQLGLLSVGDCSRSASGGSGGTGRGGGEGGGACSYIGRGGGGGGGTRSYVGDICAPEKLASHSDQPRQRSDTAASSQALLCTTNLTTATQSGGERGGIEDASCH